MPTPRMLLAAMLLVLAVGGVPTCARAEERTITGELLDPASYVKDGRRGGEMTEATYEAIEGGQTLALVEDGTGSLYLLFAEQPGEDPNELAYDYVNQSVKVTGQVYERGGLRGIVPSLIVPAVAPQDAGAAAGSSPGASSDAPAEAP